MRLTELLRPPPSLIDLESALLAELGTFSDGDGHVPNAWTVDLTERDLRRRAAVLPGWSAALAECLVDEQERLGLPGSGLVTVSFAGAAGTPPGTFRIRGAVAPGEPAVAARPELLPGCPHLTLAAGGNARHGTPQAAGIDREVMLPVGTFVIGRDRDADLRLDDATVSPRHLSLEVSAERVRLTDLGSVNGTTVDGVPTVTADLVDGNRIELGETTLLFHRDHLDDDGGRQGGEGELPSFFSG